MNPPKSRPRRTGDPLAFVAGTGEMASRIRALDWSATPLGDIARWPQSLKAVVRVLLTSRFAMWMAWGPELTFLCNDAYLPTTGIKRDWVLGARSDNVWAEIWSDIGPRIEHVLKSGEATWDEALRLYLERSGFSEETYHTFSYSPLADDKGHVVGMLCVVAEVTERVIGERQLGLLRDVGGRLAAATTRAEVMASLEECLTAESRDVPAALAYLYDGERATLRREANHGFDARSRLAARSFDPLAGQSPWPFADVLTSATARLCPLGADAAATSAGVRNALVLPLMAGKGEPAFGFLVAGLNPHRAVDTNYTGFLQLLTGQVSAAIARADEYERERARAQALAELDRAKTTFFSNVSHEFRTPLTLMLAPVEVLLEKSFTELTPATKGQLEIVHRNSLRLLKLVNTLLDFSRIEAGRIQASYEPVDLASITAELASAFRAACERAGLELAVDCPPLPEGEVAFVDRDMWEKIVLNLVSNAFKFTHEGSIRVELRADDGAARLVVSDTGVGIPAEELGRVFDRFHRVPNVRGRTHEGTGIGLALVQELVKLHGGSVTAESTLGSGSRFVVSVPLGSAHLDPRRIGRASALDPTTTGAAAFVEEALRWLPSAPDDGVEAWDIAPGPDLRSSAAAYPGSGAGQRPRVLWADDNADMRDYVRRLLGERYEVEAVADGEAALAAARARPPDLVLSDIMMPRLDGFGLLQALRADGALGTVPVILLSARAGEEARIEGVTAGADDYLTKPFSARELLARVDSQIKLARFRNEARRALSLSQQRAQLAMAAAGLGAWEWHFGTGEMVLSPETRELLGLAQDAEVGREVLYSLIHPQDLAAARRAEEESVRSGRYACEFRIVLPDGRLRWIHSRGQVMGNREAGETTMMGVVADITERRRSEDRQKLLIEELNHRVKNTLAIIQSIASQTLRTSPDADAFKAAFSARLQGLARIHAVLTKAMWEAATLADIVESAITPFGNDRIDVTGPSVALPPNIAVTISLVLHELATNAAKYGALSTPAGRIGLDWSRKGGANVELVWTERGGPPLQPPSRKGFGTRMIEASASQINGTVHIDYAPEGLRVRFEFSPPEAANRWDARGMH